MSTGSDIEYQYQAIRRRQDAIEEQDEVEVVSELELGERLARARGWTPHYREVAGTTDWQDEGGHWHDQPDPENSPEDFWRFLEWAVDRCDVMKILENAARTRVLADLRRAVSEGILEVAEHD